MKEFFTDSNFKKMFSVLLFMAIISTASMLLFGCSAGNEQNKTQNNISNQTGYTGDKSFLFKDKGSNWRVDFDDDTISALYKDGVRVSANEVDQYRKMIFENLYGPELRNNERKVKSYCYRFNFDSLDSMMKNYGENYDKEKFKYFIFKDHWDRSEKDINRWREELEKLYNKNFILPFDTIQINEQMKKLEEIIKDLPNHLNKGDIEVYLNPDDFKKEMKKFKEHFRNFDFKIDTSGFNISELKKSMNELKEEIKELKKETQDLKEKLN